MYTERQRTIEDPYWVDDRKNTVIVKFNYEDGPTDIACINREAGNPDWQAVLDTFTLEEIDENTRKLDEQKEEEQSLKEEARKDSEQRAEGDLIFAAKLAIFEIEEIKKSTNRSLKSKIRKSKSVIEAQAYASVLIMKEMDNE